MHRSGKSDKVKTQSSLFFILSSKNVSTEVDIDDLEFENLINENDLGKWCSVANPTIQGR